MASTRKFINLQREHVAWAGTVVVLLVAGLLIGRQFLAPPDDAQIAPFRKWFWESRSLDLIAQVGLIFVGALGIAALLPRDKEDTGRQMTNDKWQMTNKQGNENDE